MMTKPWEIKNVSNKKAEILIYGPIFPDKVFDDEVGAKEFAEDLKEMGDITEIEIHVNSPGGNVFAAQAIYSQLKNHKATVNAYIDGIAASAASIIIMAGDTILIPTNAMIMIHNPLSIAMGDSEEMMKVADMLEKVKDSIVAAYQVKTGMEQDRLKEMMDEETWMTGKEAVEMGFADELLYAEEVTAALDGYKLAVNGVEHDLTNYSKAPDKSAQKLFHKLQPVISKKPERPDQKTQKEGEQKMDIETLKNDYPELFNSIKEESYNEGYNAGIKAENERIKSIEDIAMPGNQELVNKAKFEDTTMTAEKLAVELVKANKEKGNQHWEKVKNEAEEDNVNNVEGDEAPEEGEEDEQEQVKNWMAEEADKINEKRGAK